MSNNKSKYPKQPRNPDRKPGESVTFVRPLENQILKRKVVVVKNPAYTPKPKPK